MFSKSWLSSIILCSILAWTIICFIGTWVIIIKYGILLEGLIATVVIISFWVIPLMGLIILSLWVTPPEEHPSYVMFKELIRKGVRRISV